jgi:hypothetical protein
MPRDRLSLLCLPTALVVLFSAPACSEDTDGSGASGTTPNPPTGTTGGGASTSDGGASQSSGEDTCTDSTMCESGWFCAAEHTAGQTAAPEEGICMEDCVPLEHVPLWCMDDAACCEGTCDETSGFCVAEDGTDTTTSTEATDTGSSTGPGTTSSTGPGTTSSTSTDTGTATPTTTTTDAPTSGTGSGTTTP